MLSLLLLQNSVAQRTEKIASVFWKIEAPSGKVSSYILGTFHVFGKEWFDKFPEIREKMKHAALFFSESNGSGPDADPVTFYLDSTLPAKKFETFFGASSPKTDSFFMASFNGPEKISDRINRSKNLMEQQLLLGYYCFPMMLQYRDALLGRPFDTAELEYYMPLDNLVELYADSLKLPMRPLDDPEYMKKKSADEGIMEAEFVGIINQFIMLKTDGKSKEVETDRASYRLFDKGLFDFSLAYNQKREEIDWTTNVARNKRWATIITEDLMTKNCFIAVGIGHLFLNKKYGLLDLLEKKGFKITPVTLQMHH
ncbi:TraB/GumN family protein [Niabella aurantiaca]|uniref:TraB/GumN family protein n=1 Tax=Niabella aurantiaca TaxID=379900 RepID=UPI000376ED28|nr:TraB/GumN family protein [Niabella aurantiaca]